MKTQKSNTQLQIEVREKLRYEPSLDSNTIGITADRGLVFLSGHVHGVSQRRAAEEAAMRVDGVRAVIDELKIRPGRWGIHDADIACVASDALRQLVGLPDGRVKVVVRDGKVRLNGAVTCSEEKDIIGSTVRDAIGRSGFMDNAICVEPRTAFSPNRPDARLLAPSVTMPSRRDAQIETSPPEMRTMIVVDELFPFEGIPMTFVHHREFPEIRCEGETPTEAVLRLIHQLEQAREYAREPWQKQSVENALRDAKAYHASLPTEQSVAAGPDDALEQIIQFIRPRLDMAIH